MNYEERKAWMQEVNACNPTTDLVFSEWTQERNAYQGYSQRLEKRVDDLHTALQEALNLCSTGFNRPKYQKLLYILRGKT
jgi:hypothetical protein